MMNTRITGKSGRFLAVFALTFASACCAGNTAPKNSGITDDHASGTRLPKISPDFSRRVFARDEGELTLNWQIVNSGEQTWKGTVLFTLEGYSIGNAGISLAAGEQKSVNFKLNPSLFQTGSYCLNADLKEKDSGNCKTIKLTQLTIAPWRNPKRFPMISWPRLRETHLIHDMNSMGLNVVSFGSVEDLETITGLGAHGAIRIDTIPHMTHQRHFDAHAETYPCPISKEYLADCVIQTEALLEKFENHPSIRMVNVNTEVWGMLCFCPDCRKIIRDKFGLDPDALDAAVRARGIRRFKGSVMIPWIEEYRPKNMIVDSENPLLRYAKWYWTEGGVNIGNMVVANTLQKRRPDILALTEPLMRFASLQRYRAPIVIGDWVWPADSRDWIRVGTFVRSLARSWDRPYWLSVTTLKLRGTFAPYLVNSPPDLFLMENWLALSAFPQGLQYSQIDTMLPWEKQRPRMPIQFKSVAECEEMIAGLAWKDADKKMQEKKVLAWTPGLPEVLKNFSARVIEPFGPLLLGTRPRPGTIGVFFSFTTQVLGFENWWSAHKWVPIAEKLIRGPYAMDFLFEDQIERINLNDYKAVILPAVRFMTDDTAARFRRYIARGGLLVCDSKWGAKFPGSLVARELDAEGSNAVRKAFASLEEEQLAMDAGEVSLPKNVGSKGQGIWQTINTHIKPDYQSSSPDVLIREGELEHTRVIMVVNTKLEKGPVFGKYPNAYENSTPVKATVSIPEGTEGYAYNLLSSASTNFKNENGYFRFDVDLQPSEGEIFVFYPKAIGDIKITAGKAVPGRRSEVNINLSDNAGMRFKGVVPIKFTLTDPSGIISDYSHYDIVENGKWTFVWHVPVETELNRKKLYGNWKVAVKELASGKTDETIVQMSPLQNNKREN